MPEQILRPTSDSVFLTDWAPVSNKYQNIDEVTADDDGSYISATTDGEVQSFGVEEWPEELEGATIDKVELFIRGKQSNASYEYGPFLYFPPATVEPGDIYAPGMSYSNETQEIDRPGGGSWETTDFATLEIGNTQKNTIGMAEHSRVTQKYLIVTYTAAAEPTGPPDALHGPAGSAVRQGPGGRSKRQGP